jgi:cholesterol oxidase
MNRQATVPTSIRFTEEMRGYVSFGEEDYGRGAREGHESNTRLMFHLTIEIEDLDRFAADDRREARAGGWVRCEALGGRLSVEGGAFNLFVDDHDSARQRMLYRLFFRDRVGHPLTLAGFKVVREGSGGHVWRDTTTLYVRVLRGHVEEGDEPGAEVVASGILRLRPWDFARQLSTFRAGGPTPAKRVAAVVRFDALFLGALWQVYGRRFAGLDRVSAGIGRRSGWWKPR